MKKIIKNLTFFLPIPTYRTGRRFANRGWQAGILHFAFLILHSAFSNAQDIHFSQFYSSPLYLNPALTGYSSCLFRAGLDYRSQWRSVTTPFITQSAFVDSKISPKWLRHDWLGIGGLFYNDKAGDGSLSNTKATLCVSYNKGLNRRNTFYTSIGATFGFVNRSVDISKLIFDNQWNGIGFDNTLPQNEALASGSFIYKDFSAGILNTYLSPSGNRIFLGASLNHINMPVVSFYNDNNRLGMKTIIHGGTSFTLSPRKVEMKPEFMVSIQKMGKEIIAGSNFQITFNDLYLYLGIWSRVLSDIIPVAGIEYHRIRFLMSYDVNISRLKPASNLKGGLELSLIATFGCRNKVFDIKSKGLPCPSF